MIGITTFQRGTSYQSTARNINEKVAQLEKEHGAVVVISIDYREKLIFYDYMKEKEK